MTQQLFFSFSSPFFLSHDDKLQILTLLQSHGNNITCLFLVTSFLKLSMSLYQLRHFSFPHHFQNVLVPTKTFSIIIVSVSIGTFGPSSSLPVHLSLSICSHICLHCLLAVCFHHFLSSLSLCCHCCTLYYCPYINVISSYPTMYVNKSNA